MSAFGAILVDGERGDRKEQENEQKESFSFGGAIFMRVDEGAFRTGREVGESGQFSSAGNADADSSVDCPAVCFEQRAECALSEYDRGDEHGRERDEEHQADDDERELPEREAGDAGCQGCESAADGADGDSESCDGADIDSAWRSSWSGGYF